MTNTGTKFITAFTALLGLCAASGAGLAQDQDEAVSDFTRIQGGAIYDLKYGVDGAPVSDEFTLVHIVCTDGSKGLRVMLPASPEDDGMVFSSDGPKSTLSSVRGTYRVTFVADGKPIRKTMQLKPVNDPKSKYDRQFMLRVDYADPLWNALTSKHEDDAVMLIGEGGKPVGIPVDSNLQAALKSCGL